METKNCVAEVGLGISTVYVSCSEGVEKRRGLEYFGWADFGMYQEVTCLTHVGKRLGIFGFVTTFRMSSCKYPLFLQTFTHGLLLTFDHNNSFFSF